MVLVDSHVASDIMGFCMMWIACMLRIIELMTLVGAFYIGYIYMIEFYLHVILISDLVKFNKVIEETPIEYLTTLYKNRWWKNSVCTWLYVYRLMIKSIAHSRDDIDFFSLSWSGKKSIS